MGRHGADRLPVRGRRLRSAYTRLLDTYGRLLRDHRRLEAEHQALLERVTSAEAPTVEVELWKPRPGRRPSWARDTEPMDVDRACELVREQGLLTSAGG